MRPAWDTAQSHFHVRYTSLDEGIRDDFKEFRNDREQDDTIFSKLAWVF